MITIGKICRQLRSDSQANNLLEGRENSTVDNVGLFSLLFYQLRRIKVAIDKLGLGVFCCDFGPFLAVPDQAGNLPVWVRLIYAV